MKNEIRFSVKVAQGTQKLNRCLESCFTPEQLETSRVFCDNVLTRWEWDFKQLPKNEQQRTTPLVQACIKSIHQTYAVQSNIFEEAKNKRVVVRGYC